MRQLVIVILALFGQRGAEIIIDEINNRGPAMKGDVAEYIATKKPIQIFAILFRKAVSTTDAISMIWGMSLIWLDSFLQRRDKSYYANIFSRTLAVPAPEADKMADEVDTEDYTLFGGIKQRFKQLWNGAGWTLADPDALYETVLFGEKIQNAFRRLKMMHADSTFLKEQAWLTPVGEAGDVDLDEETALRMLRYSGMGVPYGVDELGEIGGFFSKLVKGIGKVFKPVSNFVPFGGAIQTGLDFAGNLTGGGGGGSQNTGYDYSGINPGYMRPGGQSAPTGQNTGAYVNVPVEKRILKNMVQTYKLT